MMNDKEEGGFLLYSFFENEKDKKIWENDFFPANTPFVFSLISTNQYTKRNGSLPMWRMYGDNCKGVLIRFEYNRIKQFCDSQSLLFNNCSYFDNDSIKSEIKNLKSDFPKSSVHSDILNNHFLKLLQKCCFTKRIDWKYENEYRIVKISDSIHSSTKITDKGIVEYLTISVPIEFVKEICLGPLCESENTIPSINQLKSKLAIKFKNRVNFKVTKSKIAIR